MNPTTRQLATLMGSASLLTLGSAISAQAQQVAQAQTAQTASEVPEQVLVTGSLIHGAMAVGVPVTTVTPLDFTNTAALNISDFLKTIPAINVPNSANASASPGGIERGTYVTLHGLGGTRGLLMVNGMRYPIQTSSASQIDPSVVPELAVDHVDVLADGASATYGSDAVSGVINVIMKRGFEGAITELRFGTVASKLGGGANDFQISQLYGHKWDSGDVTLSYHFENIGSLDNTADRLKFQWTHDYTPWGLDNKSPITSSDPGIVSTGKPSSSAGTTCTNCFSVPAGQNGVGLTWVTLQANKGVFNEVNTFALADLNAPGETNAFTGTFDQNIYPGIQFFADAFYSNRRNSFLNSTAQTPNKANLGTYAVPTLNPFYPVGAPAGLQVSYSFVDEITPRLTVGEIAKRYDGGFNLDLPHQWTGRIFASFSDNYSFEHAVGAVNLNATSAALGNTISVAASGNTPGATFTKPASVPYLNVFCDPAKFRCNDPQTLAYISGLRLITVSYKLQEYGANFDGPLLSLPGGDLKAAIGFDYTDYSYNDEEIATFSSNIPGVESDQVVPFAQQVPAAFVQFNIPVFGDANAIPLVKRLNFELSGRYDHYYTFGVTKNPKVAFDWTPFDGIIVSGAWGTSFHAPGPADTSATNTQSQPINIAAGSQSNSAPLCTTVGGTPVPGSVAAILNPTCSAALQFQGGIQISGGSDGAAVLRANGDGIPQALGPEKATNTSISVDFLPTFLPGLEVRGTYWNVKITNSFFSPSVGTNGPVTLNSPIYRYSFILPGDPNFAKDLAAILAQPNNQTPSGNAASIAWIQDAASQNGGFLRVSGVDFMANYTFPVGDGGISAGVNGTYNLTNTSATIVGGPTTSPFRGEACNCNSIAPRLKARLNLGWTDGVYSAIVFVNYTSHYFSNQAFPPAAFLTNFPNYSNIIPAFTTVDLSLGYTTGDTPTNEYLKNLSFNFVVNDILDKVAPMGYFVNTAQANPSAFDSRFGETALGRTINFILTKKF